MLSFHDKELSGRLAWSRYAGKPAIRKAVEAARASGINVTSIELAPDGSIRISEIASTATVADEFDRLVRQASYDQGRPFCPEGPQG